MSPSLFRTRQRNNCGCCGTQFKLLLSQAIAEMGQVEHCVGPRKAAELPKLDLKLLFAVSDKLELDA